MAAMAAAIFGPIRTVTENRRWPGGPRGAKPPPVHADWPPGMRSPSTCAVAAANSPSASHLAAGSPQHPASLRPPSDQPAISMTALRQAHPAAQYNTAFHGPAAGLRLTRLLGAASGVRSNTPVTSASARRESLSDGGVQAEDRHDPLPHIALLTTALKSAYRNTASLSTHTVTELRKLLIAGGRE
jgi:hypothetical protein